MKIFLYHIRMSGSLVLKRWIPPNEWTMFDTLLTAKMVENSQDQNEYIQTGPINKIDGRDFAKFSNYLGDHRMIDLLKLQKYKALSINLSSRHQTQ